MTGIQDLENGHLAQIQPPSNTRTLVSRNKGDKYAHQFVMMWMNMRTLGDMNTDILSRRSRLRTVLIQLTTKCKM